LADVNVSNYRSSKLYGSSIKSIYGGQRHTFDQNLCFEVQVDDFKEMIVLTQSNVVDFTLNFKNGTIKSFLESSGIAKKSRIYLSTSDLSINAFDLNFRIFNDSKF
jgi:hypothetical protein